MNHQHYRGKKVLVTGGAGFIGANLVGSLLDNGADVIAVDDLSAGKMENLREFEAKENFNFIEKSVTEVAGWDDIFLDLDVVFHNAASKKNICLVDPQKDLAINAGGTLNLLDLSLKFDVERFIHASTGSVYGEPEFFPTNETHPLNPVSYYGVSKLAGERYVNTFNKLYGLKTTILRYFHVYGAKQESNEFGGVVSIFARNILNNEPLIVHGDGGQLRSFTWVQDLVRANLLAGASDVAVGRVYNVASGIQVSVLELAQKMVEMAGSNSPIEFGPELLGDIRYFNVGNEAVIQDLGLDFSTDFWVTLAEILDEIMASIVR